MPTVEAFTTDERADFVAAIHDFGARECGTREQRDALTDSGRETHSHARIPGYGIGTSLIAAKAVEKFGTEEQAHDFVGGVCLAGTSEIERDIIGRSYGL